MQIQTRTWEGALMALANEGWRMAGTAVVVNPEADQTLLDTAYTYCNDITAEHSRSFHLASSLLPSDKRQAVRALYAFCRITDDIVDCPETESIQETLQVWHQHAFSYHPPATDLAAVAWADARIRYHIPVRYAEQLIEGVSRDLQQTRYETFDDLATYCYGVASTVGLMSMHIIGFAGADAVSYAVKLGLALQLTNILRDIGEDWQRGRLYLPLEELAMFNLSEADVAAGVVDDRWRRFMRFQIARNRQLYAEAWPGIQMLNKDGRFAIAAAAGLYRAILEDIENHDYDVFNRRAHIGTWGKLKRLPTLWAKSRP
ncbi:MAG: squalene/phytoene synthase family protein [Chloroflexota bacterium]|nr:squalene/phytoene synthase family protein [Anaerolineales bacterium]MCB8969120.1 squalene/phytoene synthase family protein [Ardenticatenaceae bacterium]